MCIYKMFRHFLRFIQFFRVLMKTQNFYQKYTYKFISKIN